MYTGNDRRKPEGFKLRTYIDAIREAENTPLEVWISEWASKAEVDSMYISRYDWICVLRRWALEEAHRIALDAPPAALNFD